MIGKHLIVLGVLAVGLAGCNQAEVKVDADEGPRVVAVTDIEAGRYLVLTGGCNDCHTPNYPQTGGRVPETEWLKGSRTGFKGPWGTTYPHNLRRSFAAMSEDDWVEMASSREALPPMPWPSLRAMSETDKRAIYRYVKSLPVEGELSPTALPPGQTPTTPYEDMGTRQPEA